MADAGKINTRCPHCGTRMKVSNNHIGQVAKCPVESCGQKFTIEHASNLTLTTPPINAKKSVHAAPAVAAYGAQRRRLYLIGAVTCGLLLGVLGTLIVVSGTNVESTATTFEGQTPSPANETSTFLSDSEIDTPPADKRPTNGNHAARYPSPQACYEAYIQSFAKGDTLGVLNCSTKRQQQIVLGMKAYSVEMIAFRSHERDQRDKAKQILREHGLGQVGIMGALQMASMPNGDIGDERVMAVFGRVGASITDRAAFIHQADQFLNDNGMKGEVGSASVATLADDDRVETIVREAQFAIDGDRATVSLQLPDAGSHELRMVRVGGGWLMGEGKLPYTGITRHQPGPPGGGEFTPAQQLAMAALQSIGQFREATIDYYSSPPKVAVVRYECTYDGATDGQIEPLGELTFLRWVDLGGLLKLTDAGVAPLASCRDLEYLCLNDTQVTDRGLSFVSQLPELQTLLVSGTQVTDALLDRLANHRKLEAVNVINTQVTEAAVERFRKKHPDCFINAGKRAW